MKKIIFIFLFTVFLLLGCSRDNTIEHKDILIFELEGEEVIELKLNEEYEEIGFIAMYDISGEDLTNSVVIKSNLNTSIVGTYKISYELTIDDITEELTRTVVVLSYEEKEISLDLLGSKTIKVDYKSTFVDPFVVATDERLGKDISVLVEVIGLDEVDTSIAKAIYTITYNLKYNGVFLSVFRTVEVEEDTGVSFDINRDTTTYNNYSVGEEYIEYGVEIIDNVTGLLIEDYTVEDNFVYENNLVAKGTYSVEYSIEVREVKYSTTRVVVFLEEGIELELNNNSSEDNAYFVGEDYIEHGITVIDKLTGEIYTDYTIKNNLEYNDENQYILEGSYNIVYTIEIRCTVYEVTRIVNFSHILEKITIQYDGFDDSQECPYIWTISVPEELESENIQLFFIKYWILFEENSLDGLGEVSLITTANDKHQISTKEDELVIKSFKYIWNEKTIEGEIV